MLPLEFSPQPDVKTAVSVTAGDVWSTAEGFSIAPAQGDRWNSFGPGDAVTAREFVSVAAGMLKSVVRWLGDRGTDELSRGLRSTLATSGRESALPLDSMVTDDDIRSEISRQADDIGSALIDWVSVEMSGWTATDEVEPAPFVRSHCDGHPWTLPAVHLLTGPFGGPESMQGYNEWLHQMVLLRDALLPFANWEEVILPVNSDGLRRLEEHREAFLAELFFRQVRHTSIVGYARQVVGGGDGPAGYGFRYSGGVVLPAVVGRSIRRTPRALLSWQPAPTAGHADADATFVYAEDDYFSAARSIPNDAAGESDHDPSDVPEVSVRVVKRPLHDLGRTDSELLSLEICIDDDPARYVDLGQAVRGHRYAYHADQGSGDVLSPAPPARRLTAGEVLAAPQLVWARRGTFMIDALDNSYVGLALLGKIYPENVMISGNPRDQEGAGKKGPARFVIFNVESS